MWCVVWITLTILLGCETLSFPLTLPTYIAFSVDDIKLLCRALSSLHEYSFRIIIMYVLEDREHDLNSKSLTQYLYYCHNSVVFNSNSLPLSNVSFSLLFSSPLSFYLFASMVQFREQVSDLLPQLPAQSDHFLLRWLRGKINQWFTCCITLIALHTVNGYAGIG
jgi:predicted PurR-regulated permease PerM